MSSQKLFCYREIRSKNIIKTEWGNLHVFKIFSVFKRNLNLVQMKTHFHLFFYMYAYEQTQYKLKIQVHNPHALKDHFHINNTMNKTYLMFTHLYSTNITEICTILYIFAGGT